MSSPPGRRFDGYIRVSRVGKRKGPSFISPLVQREAIEDWASRSDVELLRIYEELDESGSRADRPLLNAAIERIEREISDGLVVWRVDRFGRSLLDGLQHIERIRSGGGRFCAVGDGLDTETEAGRLALKILLSVAEFRLEGIRASWDSARKHAIRRGVWITKPYPVGYRRTRSGRLRPDPVTGPIITELYKRRAAGHTLLMCCLFLEEQGVLTGKGNPGWGTDTLSKLLRRRVYLGVVYSGAYFNENAHPPLIDAATWHAAQTPTYIRHRTKHVALLTGVARCAGCTHMLRPFLTHVPGRVQQMVYSCSKRHAAGTCPAPANISAHKLDPYVTEVAIELLKHRGRAPLQRVAAAEACAAEAEKKLARYRDNDHIETRIGHARWLDGLTTRREEVRCANEELFAARARLGMHALPPAGEVREMLRTLDLIDRREYLRQIIDTVFVAKGHGDARSRVTVCPVGTAPAGLPRRGDAGKVLRTIEPRRRWVNPSRPRPADLSVQSSSRRRRSRVNTVDEIANAYAAFGHVIRLRIVFALRDGEASPSEVASRLGDVTVGNVAYHFRTLHRAGLISQTRVQAVRGALEHFYVLAAEGQDLLDKLELVDPRWRGR